MRFLANSTDPDHIAPEKEQSDQDLHGLPFYLYHLDEILHYQGSHRPWKVLENDLGPGRLLEF